MEGTAKEIWKVAHNLCIKVHPDAAGARKSNGEQSIGRSKGG